MNHKGNVILTMEGVGRTGEIERMEEMKKMGENIKRKKWDV